MYDNGAPNYLLDGSDNRIRAGGPFREPRKLLNLPRLGSI